MTDKEKEEIEKQLMDLDKSTGPESFGNSLFAFINKVNDGSMEGKDYVMKSFLIADINYNNVKFKLGNDPICPSMAKLGVLSLVSLIYKEIASEKENIPYEDILGAIKEIMSCTRNSNGRLIFTKL